MSNITVNKMNFAGLQLDVITGHPEHELLFKGTQVATVIGLKNPKVAIRKFQMRTSRIGKMMQVRDLVGKVHRGSTLDSDVNSWSILCDCPRWRDVWLMTEEALYEMLLAGNAPQTEPFRKWVTEEVLPTIRKTGSYNVETSITAEGIQFAAIFQSLPESSRQGAWKCS
ncbi:Bro-N domain-containing protein [Pectobacterium sp. CHL-2024]|uniref:BRO-N domain-containing protein n=1 Tax=Pectobacterium sp. CHL-2024 TaxID=3377079 RepID=UPI003814CCAB